MKAAYLGAVRGYQAPVYRPGMGWSMADADRRATRGAPVFATRKPARFRSGDVTRRCTTGLRGKVAIVATVVIVAALLALVLGGYIQS
jgi:hypothetical protein